MRLFSCHTIARCAVGALLISALASCQLFSDSDRAAKRGKPAKARYAASDYVKHLALAQLAPQDKDVNLDAIRAYAKQKAKKPQSQALLVLDYKSGGDAAMQQVVAPIAVAGKSREFPDLLDIMNQLAANHATLHDMRIVAARLAPDKSLAVPEADIEAVLDRQEKHLLAKADALPPQDTIRIQFRLLAFFTEHRFRDAAYLTADNVKKAIASLPHGEPADAQTVKQLSQELERLESDMRKVLPFTL
jgi:hypothetical protein